MNRDGKALYKVSKKMFHFSKKSIAHLECKRLRNRSGLRTEMDAILANTKATKIA